MSRVQWSTRNTQWCSHQQQGHHGPQHVHHQAMSPCPCTVHPLGVLTGPPCRRQLQQPLQEQQPQQGRSWYVLSLGPLHVPLPQHRQPLLIHLATTVMAMEVAWLVPVCPWSSTLLQECPASSNVLLQQLLKQRLSPGGTRRRVTRTQKQKQLGAPWSLAITR